MPSWFLLMIPQLAAGLAKLIGSRTAVRNMNRYNSPFEQMQRIRAAGLPYAAFEGGQAGAQSQLPDLSGYDTIGNAIGTGINQGNQIRMFEELLRKAIADADIIGNLRDVSNEETKGALGYTYKDPLGNDVPIARVSKLLDFQLKEYSTWSAKHKSDIDKIDRDIKTELNQSGKLKEETLGRIESILLSNDLARQAWRTNDARSAAQRKIVSTMEKGGLSFFEALLLQLLGSIGGGVSYGGMNFGF